MINELFPDYSNKPSKHKHFEYIGNSVANETNPAVSIVTPIYNTGEVFYETVECILSQSLQNFEWIIVNDGSSNPVTLDILSKVQKSDNRIKVISHSSNKGLPASRNTGIKNANGNYLFFIDSDDLIELTTLEKFYNFLRINQDYDFVNSYVVGFGHMNYLWTGNFSQTDKFFNENPITATFMAKKEVFSTLTFDESIKGGLEDWDFWMRSAVNGKWGYTIPEYLFWYRRSDPGQKKWDSWDNKQKHQEYLKGLKEKYYAKIQEKGFPIKHLNMFERNTLYSNDLNPDNVLQKKKKRILYILPWFNLGGADKFNLDLLEGLVKQFGWEATILSTLSSKNEWLPLFDKVTPDIFNLPNYFSIQDYHRYLDYIIKTRQPDVIFLSHSQFGYWMCPYIKQRYPNIPVVDFLHVEDPHWAGGWGYLRMSTLMSNVIDKTFVSSHQLKSWLKQAYSRNTDTIEVCYTNVDIEKWKHRENKIKAENNEWRHIDKDTVIILFAGRIDKQKQPLVIINSIKYLYKKTDKFRFLLIGDGPDYDIMKKEIAKCGLKDKDRIWCYGAMKNEQISEYLDIADIFFLPSEYEGISLAIYEAMAKGLAIVASDVGGQKELVTTDCGFLVKRSTPEQESKQYANILYQLIEDRELLKSMGKAGTERVKKHFGLDKMITQMNTSLTSANLKTKPNYPIHYEYQTLLMQYLCTDLNNGNIGNTLNQNKNNSYAGNETAEIKEWYRLEYEVLPLWYKQFGHVIKAVTGKRSFKSLIKK